MNRYAIGLGSNRRGRAGRPEAVLRHAAVALAGLGQIRARSRTIATSPLGPGSRRYANAAILLASPLPPPALLAALKEVERRCGRRPGRRWGDRVLDLDILLWSGGGWRSTQPALIVPHPALAGRAFALAPLAEIAPGWRIGPCIVRHAMARLTRAGRLPTRGSRSGL